MELFVFQERETTNKMLISSPKINSVLINKYTSGKDPTVLMRTPVTSGYTNKEFKRP
jgi:hypothetical protein